MKKLTRIGVPVLLSTLLLLTAGCGGGINAPSSAWIPYWDYENALSEISLGGSTLTDLVAFAAVMDSSNDGLYLPEGMEETASALVRDYGGKKTVFLSVTNDVLQADGTYLQKDTGILRRLFQSTETMDAHINELISLCRRFGVEGLEIDYEAIGSDKALWAEYVSFANRLYQRTEEEGLRLRLVLGAFDVNYVTFFNGPEYVIMCYNLYGTHSGAGPKADKKFLGETFERNSVLPGSVTMAFATGGFDWGSDGTCVSLTQLEAEQLREENHVANGSVTRDKGSKCLRFTYKKDGLSHEVWYADGETLSYWISLANNAGFDRTAIWRLGGNNISQLEGLLG